LPKRDKALSRQRKKSTGTEFNGRNQETYPGEQFELEGRGGFKHRFSLKYLATKIAFTIFKLYDRLDSDKWEPYDLRFTTYWTTNTK